MAPMAAVFAIGSDKPIPLLPETCSKEARHFVGLCLNRQVNDCFFLENGMISCTRLWCRMFLFFFISLEIKESEVQLKNS